MGRWVPLLKGRFCSLCIFRSLEICMRYSSRSFFLRVITKARVLSCRFVLFLMFPKNAIFWPSWDLLGKGQDSNRSINDITLCFGLALGAYLGGMFKSKSCNLRDWLSFLLKLFCSYEMFIGPVVHIVKSLFHCFYYRRALGMVLRLGKNLHSKKASIKVTGKVLSWWLRVASSEEPWSKLWTF